MRAEQLGARVRALREARGWSQGQLLEAARAHLPGGETFARVTLSRLENGHQWPRSGILKAVAAALGVSVEYLLGTPEVAAGEGRSGIPLPEPELAGVVARLNEQPPAVRERVAVLVADLLDVLDEAQAGQGLGFDLDEADRELDALLRESGLDEEARSVLWSAIEGRMRNRRFSK